MFPHLKLCTWLCSCHFS